MIYLIAHVNSAGYGIGQCEINAESEEEAREQFARLYPEREILLGPIPKDS